MYRKLSLEQNTNDWLAWRKTRLGSSDAPIIMGNSPYCSPRNLWEEKLGLSERKSVKGYWIDEGKRLEEIIRKRISHEMGIDFQPDCVELLNKPYSSSGDGVSPCGTIMLEIKTGGKELWDLARTGNVKPDHFTQCQHHMLVRHDVKRLYIVIGNDDPNQDIIIEVKRDEEYIKSLEEKLDEFQGFIDNFMAPPLSDMDYEKRDDKEWNEVAQAWIYEQSKAALHKKNEEELRKKLIELSEGRSSVGGGIQMTKVTSKGTVQYDQIPELFCVNLDAYRKTPSVSYRITRTK